MKKILILLMLVLMLASVSAETCFTVLNSPTTERTYWKAISYDLIKDNQFENYGWLDKTANINPNTGLGVGYQYNLRIDKACFGNYLLSNIDSTGVNSGSLYIEKYNDDVYSSNIAVNALYTISRKKSDLTSLHYVKDIKTGTINGINYIQKPQSLSTSTKYNQIKQGLCNSNYKITDQLYKIMDTVWSNIIYSDVQNSCSGYSNIVECALNNGKGDSAVYATSVALLARDCNIPTRIVYGISEGSFDGIDLQFQENKKHFWIEYYDDGWFTLDVTEEGTTSPDSIEINCLDGLDNDKDSKIDCKDENCAFVTFCQGAYPTTTNFYNSLSTDLSSLPNAYSINNLVLANTYGSIQWTNQALDLRNKNLDTSLTIIKNNVILTDVIPALNKPANVTIKGVSLVTPRVLNNGKVCENCRVISYSNNNVVFEVPGIGSYVVKDNSTLTSLELTLTMAVNNETFDNVSYLPAVPQSDSKFSQWIDKLMSAKTTFLNYSTLTKVIIIGLVIIVIYYIFIRRRY